jgi:CO/xanthine dehydrogenase Mo-binding subunit
MGLAVEDAAGEIRAQLASIAATTFGVEAAGVTLSEGGIVAGDRAWTFAELLHAYYGIDSGEIIGIGRISPHSRGGRLALAPLFWETAAGQCGIELDEDTGEIRVRRYVSVADIGRVINRLGAEGQDEGAAIQGLGHTLSEELIYSDGQPINASLIDYHVPTIDEVPDVFTTVLIENRDGPGPGGMRGMGEGAILPMAPAIANALATGYGVRLRELPLTPERVWRALQRKRGG